MSEASGPVFDFSSIHTDNFPELLRALNISLAVTSYQSGRLCFVRSDGHAVDTCFKSFPRPMGITADEDSITLGTLTRVLNFRRSDQVLAELRTGIWEDQASLTSKIRDEASDANSGSWIHQRQLELAAFRKADSLYIPRSAHLTGMINIHDIAWGNAGLWAVNSTFSCLCTLSADFSFVPEWKPPFISELAPEDRCHLNGMALKDGKPKYVTTFNRENSRDSWRDRQIHDGTLIDVETNEVLLSGLVMPHSPRYYRGAVYLCESGTGKLLRFDPKTGKTDVLANMPGFPRGITFYGPLMFVGLSKVRSSDIKNPIPISKTLEKSLSGVWVFDMETFQEIAHISFEGDVDQIYDIAVLRNATWPELIDFDHPRARHLFDYPELRRQGS